MIGVRLLEAEINPQTGIPVLTFDAELQGREYFVVRTNSGRVFGAVVVSQQPDIMQSIGMP